MRKLIIYIILLTLCIGAIPVSAETEPAAQEPIYAKDVLIDSPFSQLARGDFDPSRFDEGLQGFSADGKPVLLIIRNRPYFMRGATLTEHVLNHIEEEPKAYVALTEPSTQILLHWKSQIFYRSIFYGTELSFIADICTGGVTQTFRGEIHTITDIIAFDASDLWSDDGINPKYMCNGTAVFYVTDGGTFVRYYENFTSEAVEYTFDEYYQLANAYTDYLISINAGHKNGNPISFLTYANNPEAYPVVESSDPSLTVADPPNYLLPIIIGTVTILALAVTAFFIIRKKKA